MDIILASQSPRRKELLGHIFEQFTILPAKGEETAVLHTPDQYAGDLSRQKAQEIAREHFHAVPSTLTSPVKEMKELPSDSLTLIIGADTIVYAQGKVLGKPADPKEAFAMLSLLSGKTHTVYTGVTLLLLNRISEDGKTGESGYEILKELSFSESTEVIVDNLSKEEIDAYIASKDPFDKTSVHIPDTGIVPEWKDKAGAYAIQGTFGAKFVKRIEGEYNNVVGLPTARLYQELKKLGVV